MINISPVCILGQLERSWSEGFFFYLVDTMRIILMVVGYIWRIKSAERTMRWLEDVWRESSLTIHKLRFVGMITKL